MDIYQWITSIFTQYGYLLVFLSAFFESLIFIGFILPGGVIIILGGYYAQNNQLSFTLVLLLSWIGMFIGDQFNYFLGHLGLRGILRWDKKGKILEKKRLAQKYIDTYGPLSILVSHIIGQLRSVICFTAGSVGFPLRIYIPTTFIASFLWSLMFVGVGFFLADSAGSIKNLGEKVTWTIVGIAIFFLCLHILKNILVGNILKKKRD